jgi:hypothetical protein
MKSACTRFVEIVIGLVYACPRVSSNGVSRIRATALEKSRPDVRVLETEQKFDWSAKSLVTRREMSLKRLFDISIAPAASIYPQVVRRAMVEGCWRDSLTGSPPALLNRTFLLPHERILTG